MKSKKATKRALLSSALSLVLCFSMLLGTTFAWFTDEAKTGVNTIQSGTLDVELMNEDGSASLKGQSLKFVKADGGDEVLWEPGVTFRTEGFQIVNLGNLALKYKVVINGISDGSYAELLDVIEFYVTTEEDDGDAAKRISLDDLASNYTPLAPKGETLAEVKTVSGNDGVNSVEKTFTNVDDKDGPFYLFGHMDEDAGNEYQDKQLTGLGITVYATQVEAEYDSFDNEYDEDAAPAMVPVAKVERILEPVTVTSALSGEDYTLDTAYTFSTTETYDAAELSPYAEWNADFVITFDRDVVKETAGLAGQYDTFSSDWLAFEIPEDITAGVPVRLLEYAGIGMTYEELCLLVKEFDCGAFDVDNQNAGTTMTVELRLFETQKAATGSGTAAPGGETGNYKTIAAYTYTFPVKTAEGLKNALAEGGTVTLAEDITVTETMTVAAGKDATIDLNGHNMSYAVNNSGAAAIISNKGTLELTGEGTISFVAADPDLGTIPAYATNTITNTGTLTIGEGVVITNGSEGGASYAVDNHGTFIMNGGKLVGDRCALRVAKYNQDNVKFVMNGGTITAKTPAWVQLPGSDSAAAPTITVEINGGTMQSTKTSSEDNDVMYTYSHGNSHANTKITINGGEFLGGTVSIGAGYKGDAPTLTINGGTFEYDVLQWNADSTSTVLYTANK